MKAQPGHAETQTSPSVRRRKHRARTRNLLCRTTHPLLDKADTIVGENLTARMNSARYRHKETTRRLHGWVRGIMAATLTSISRRRGSASRLVNPASTSHIASRTNLLQGQYRWDWFCCPAGVVWNAHTKAACNIRVHCHDAEIMLWMPDPGGQGPARGTDQDRGGDSLSRTRVAGARKHPPINRERITFTC